MAQSVHTYSSTMSQDAQVIERSDIRKLKFFHTGDHDPFETFDPVGNGDTNVSIREVPSPDGRPTYEVLAISEFGTPQWQGSIICSNDQTLNPIGAASKNRIGALGSKGNCELPTRYDIAHDKVFFQQRVERIDGNPYTGDVLPRSLIKFLYDNTHIPSGPFEQGLFGKPYFLCDMELDTPLKTLRDMLPPADDETYSQPLMMWRRIYVDVDLDVKGFIIAGPTTNVILSDMGYIYEVQDDTTTEFSNIAANFSQTTLGTINDGMMMAGCVDDSAVNAPVAHMFVLNAGTLRLRGGKNYLFPIVPKAENYNNSNGPRIYTYKHAWPVTPFTERWYGATTPTHDYNNFVFRAPLLILILSDGREVMI